MLNKYHFIKNDNRPLGIKSYATGQSAQLEEFGAYSADEALRGMFLTCSPETRLKVELFIKSEAEELILYLNGDRYTVRRA